MNLSGILSEDEANFSWVGRTHNQLEGNKRQSNSQQVKSKERDKHGQPQPS